MITGQDHKASPLITVDEALNFTFEHLQTWDLSKNLLIIVKKVSRSNNDQCPIL